MVYHCPKNKQLILHAFSGKDPAKGVFNIIRTYEENFDANIILAIIHFFYRFASIYLFAYSYSAQMIIKEIGVDSK